jgi:hypothetical protein
MKTLMKQLVAVSAAFAVVQAHPHGYVTLEGLFGSMYTDLS